MRSYQTAKINRRPIKVLFISHTSGRLGAEKSLLLLLKNIDRKLVEPIVVVPGPGPLKEQIHDLNIRTYNVWSPPWVRPKTAEAGSCRGIIKEMVQEMVAVFRLCRIISTERVAAVYTNTAVKISGAIGAFIVKKPHLWHIREIIRANPNLHSLLPEKMLFRLISKTSDIIIANSNATAAQFDGTNSNGRIRVIYNAVEPGEPNKSDCLVNIGGVRSTDWIVAVIGQLLERKAQDDAIRAVKIAEKEIPNMRLLVIGEGNTDYKNYLKQLASELDVVDHVIFTGYRDDVPQILPNCRLLLVPSWNEPFGRTVIEAMAAGIPVIGANSGGLKEVIRNKASGYLVPPKNPAEIAEKMIYLFHHPDIAKQMGAEGKKLTKENFSIQNYTESIQNAVEEVISAT